MFPSVPALLSFGLACWVVVAGAQPLPCDGRVWLLRATTNGGGSELYEVRVTDNLPVTASYVLVAQLPWTIQAAGYSVRDGHLYGLAMENNHLIRIGAGGSWEDLGLPQGLDSSLVYTAGDVSPTGNNLFVLGRPALDEPDRDFYNIRLFEPGHPAGALSVISTEPVRIDDVAFDPEFGGMRGFDALHHRIVNVTTAGNVTDNGYVPQSQFDRAGGIFYLPDGDLYGFAAQGGVDKLLVRFRKTNGTVVSQAQAPAGTRTDACSCAYRFGFARRWSSRRVLPCSELRLVYRFRNTSAIARRRLDLRDTLAAGFVILEVEKAPFYGLLLEGPGSTRLHYHETDVLLGADSVVLRVQVPADTGTWPGRAWLRRLPLALDTLLPSNFDTLTVIGAPENVIEPDTVVLCPGSTVRLEAAGGGLAYRWSHGDTTAAVLADAPGWWAVTVEGACATWTDSVLVVARTPAPAVHLPKGETLPAGTPVALFAQAEGDGPFSYRWTVAGQGTLSCAACAMPALVLYDTVRVAVQLTDGQGCVAADTAVYVPEPDLPVYAPNAFSPNGDGINDRFYLQAEGAWPVEWLEVYDRWGALVWRRTDGLTGVPADGWDGRSHDGSPLPTGVYLWRACLRGPAGRRIRHHGDVLLVR